MTYNQEFEWLLVSHTFETHVLRVEHGVSIGAEFGGMFHVHIFDIMRSSDRSQIWFFQNGLNFIDFVESGNVNTSVVHSPDFSSVINRLVIVERT